MAGAICYFVWKTYFKEKTEETGEVETVEVVEEPQKGDSEEPEILYAGEEKQEVILYDGEDPNEAEELSGVVTYAGVSGSNLMIRVNIDQYLSEGNCQLILMRSGASVYNDSARIIDSAATATCEGFNVPVSELGGGSYEIVINLTADGKTGIIKGEVSI